MDQALRIDITFRDEDPDAVAAILREEGAEEVREVESFGLTGIEFVIVGILVSNALANLVIRLLPLWKCGVIVDARGSKVVTEKNCDLPRGSVLVFSPDGTEHELHKPTEQQITDLIGEVLTKRSG